MNLFGSKAIKGDRNVQKFQYFLLFVIMIKAVVTGIINITKTIRNFIYLLYCRLFVAAFLFILCRRYLML